ncbi:tRNA (adenosine(37)-N6)-threonylcarbamoyltransferase complex dimerization subunit type 1 TsaB [Demetria terragena]|uniref:tRNA (adenosine(37)-N6)-threonylcarbamoyltransferase complex dimerization subunit type 1 TsaB n=1 Tax=Demetria terragena TaxID=63959 RepID=UPI0003754249|nr:tRNA (adenosine(37)-N6)-threonylcarbamoyltransferase complex dimerization subunit type 1 TsaB [Demetria terragena]
MLLALDTATSAVTAAVHDGATVRAERSVLDHRRHTETLAPIIRDTLAAAGIAAADLSAIAVGVGPGPFTGLRVGIVTARTMGLALGIPVHGVCSLDAIAAEVAAGEAASPAEFLVATDARRKEVYWATYRDGRRTDGPHVGRAAELVEDVRALPCAGRGPELYSDALPHAITVRDVSAAALADFAHTEIVAGRALLDTEPLYLRRPDAKPRPSGP